MLRSRLVNLIVLTLFVISTVGLTGCATGPKQVDPNYSAYVATMQAQINREEKPLIDLELDDQGRVKSLKAYAPRQIVPIDQKRPDPIHPGWAIAGKLLTAATIVGGIVATGNALEGLVAAGNGATYVGSANTGSSISDVNAWSRNPGSYNSVAGDGTFTGDASAYNPITTEEAAPEYSPTLDNGAEFDLNLDQSTQ